MLEKVSFFRYEGFSCQAFQEDIGNGMDGGFTLLGRLQSHMRDLLVQAKQPSQVYNLHITH